MKYAYLALSLIVCAALNAQEDPDLAYNCRTKMRAKERGDGFHPGADSLAATTQPTYNAPGSVKLSNDWAGFATVSYLYWFAGQEGMDLATTSLFVEGGGVVVPPESGSETIFQNSNYTSGFKLGAGFHLNQYDHWVFRADYTWIREHATLSQQAPTTAPSSSGLSLITDDVLYFTSWFFQNSAAGQPLAAEEVSTSWHMNLDFIDGVASRAYYQGKSLVVTPFGGLRAALIRQNLRISANSVLNVVPPTQPVISHNKSNSWGIGPHGGVGAHWLVGSGVRLQGNVQASLLFTQYTSVVHTEDAITLAYPVTFSFQNYNCLRPMAEMDLGLGWLYYFSDGLALDLSATYDFNYLWGQNMMRTLNDLNNIGVNSASNNLYLHGLTISAALEF